jgi:hypothetical protein
MKARQLIKQTPGVAVSNISYSAQTSDITLGEGWETLNTGSAQVWVWRGFIDLAGYSMDDLTFFTQTVDIQNSLTAGGTPSFLICDDRTLVTTRALRDSEIAANWSGFAANMNGFLNNVSQDCIDLQEVIYGEWKQSVPYSAANGSFRPLAGGSFGVGNPTASDRIHITRVFSWQSGGDNDSFVLYPQNIILGGVTGQEKDLVYIERLRRAYTQDPGRNV